MAASEIRGLIALYLSRSINLSAFSDQFVEMFDEIEDSNDQDAIQLGYRVESILVKASDGFLSKSEFREALSGCVGGYLVKSVQVDFPADPKENFEAYTTDESGDLISV
jgi:hypothetical protein